VRTVCGIVGAKPRPRILKHMPTSRCSGLSPVAREILAYLRRCPGAKDTVEGINEWWLLEQRIRSSVAETKAALKQLAGQRLVHVRKSRDGRLYYCGHVPPRKSGRPKKGDSGSAEGKRGVRGVKVD
jgi:hypothetical protein